MKVQKEVDKPMQLMALEAARQDMEKRDKQSKEEETLFQMTQEKKKGTKEEHTKEQKLFSNWTQLDKGN
jgi:hypothetical protein